MRRDDPWGHRPNLNVRTHTISQLQQRIGEVSCELARG